MTDTTWNTDSDGDYSIDKFYTRGDKGQQTKQVRIYVPLDQIALMEELVQGKAIADYKTIQHVVRDALHHRLRWAVKERVQTPESAMRMSMMQMRADAENLAREKAENDSVVEAVKATLAALHETGDRKKVESYLQRLELEAESVPNPWRGELFRVVGTYRADGVVE